MCNAQIEDSAKYSRKLIKLNLIEFSPGIEYKFTETFSGYLQAGFPWFITTGGSSGKTQVGFIATVKSELRYYYNRQKRIEKGKHVEGFFANYFTLQESITLGTIYNRNFYWGFSSSYTGVHWGFQRRFRKHWFVDLNIGGGIEYLPGNISFVPGWLTGIGYAF